MRNLARSLPRTARALGRFSSQTTTISQRSEQPQNRLHRTSNRLSRVHNQLVSQMRATFRAMEMSPDLAQRGKSPLADAKANVSLKVLEKTKAEATVLLPNGRPKPISR
jgi:hypothetical protein